MMEQQHVLVIKYSTTISHDETVTNFWSEGPTDV